MEFGSFFLDMLKFDTSDFKKEEHDSFISLNEQLFSEFKYGNILNKIERVFNVALYTSFFGYKRLREIFLFIFELVFKHFKELRFESLTDSDLYRKLIFEEI